MYRSPCSDEFLKRVLTFNKSQKTLCGCWVQLTELSEDIKIRRYQNTLVNINAEVIKVKNNLLRIRQTTIKEQNRC